MPVSYDFKNASRNTPSRRGTAGRRLRFIILLLVVAAVTAGVIMLIVPKKAKISENGENTAQSVENNGKNGQNPENTTAKDDDNTPSAVKDNDNVLPVTDAGDKNDPVLQIDNTKTDKREVEDISRGKGKVLPGDLPANEDKPVFRASQAPGAAELLDRAAALNDPDEIIALLSGFLMIFVTAFVFLFICRRRIFRQLGCCGKRARGSFAEKGGKERLESSKHCA